ncbi:MAG: heavy metal-associated domain-containing protein [Ignavibacteriaceae bacterium]|jgi:Heavy-metal-associated domain.|nr:MAG: heavy-metal-associated domain-containing protein [Chlorobiota bacterium]KXK04082.1 MAG: Heavy-metal-associated domain protein [Chlorobi bacterium OLB4]MBV6397934.1 hypothetical protein [Ignavibacteria bacterium]MCC6886380.1 heavy-metal-associated domain-containing protein [Ignavibacteriales bacterium]MCE7952545.1 heavy-metal-associated domain-containing protein [Chlorobi bacterium CHB7]MDL1886659.1 heavy-metal-associated domain-containing protein [Ignavibacteria bacterium CHB1]MEB2330
MLHKIIPIAFSLFTLTVLNLNAQVKQATVEVDGFTCSLCAKGVEGQFKAIEFIKSVEANLREASFHIVFSDTRAIELSQLQTAVKDGGFTVRNIIINAAGIIDQSESGYSLTTGNTEEIKVNEISDGINPGDHVEITGIYDATKNIINISTIKKL